MASRPIWSGSISFGLVNVPVKLFSAVTPKEVRFHMLHDVDGGRIRERRVCAKDGKEVPLEHIVKGYELGKGRFVTLDRDELSAADPERSRSIDIEEFVDLQEIDPIYYAHTYYLLPDKGAGKAYALLVEAMRRSGKVGIARLVLRTKEYLAALRPREDGLSLSTMLFADEVNRMPKTSEPAGRPQERELRMAESLIESLANPFKPEKYKDEHRERVLALLERKAQGEEVVTPEKPAPRAPAVSLVKALEASLAAHAGQAPAQGTRRVRLQAARASRAPRPHRRSSRRERS